MLRKGSDGRRYSRLSIAECRRLLGNDGAHLSNEQIENLRDQLFALARVVIGTISSTPTQTTGQTGAHGAGPGRAISNWSEDSDLPDIEERAAILEFDANLPRVLADRFARQPRHRRQ